MIFSPQSDLNVIRHTQSTHSSVGMSRVIGRVPVTLHYLYIHYT